MESKEFEVFFDVTFVNVTVSRPLDHFVFHFIKDDKPDYRVRPLASASYSAIAFRVKDLCNFVTGQLNSHYNGLKNKCEDLDNLKEVLDRRTRISSVAAELFTNGTIFKFPDDYGSKEIKDYKEGDVIYIFNGILSALDMPIERTIDRMYINESGCNCLEFKEKNYPIAMYSDKTFAAGKTLNSCFNNAIYAIRREINDRRVKLNNTNKRNRQLMQIMIKLINYDDNVS
jgi:hypothetical protein